MLRTVMLKAERWTWRNLVVGGRRCRLGNQRWSRGGINGPRRAWWQHGQQSCYFYASRDDGREARVVPAPPSLASAGRWELVVHYQYKC
uniref:Uncharacterized protein n=1 Tax=Oryza rufipogon TaxID=4529 RepID=A0A0E0N9J9_ORYRU